MADVLVDTNALLRAANAGSAEHAVCKGAIGSLLRSGHTVWLIPQVLVEFWVVATRPPGVNGLGWTTAETSLQLSLLQQQFPLLSEDARTLAHLLHLVRIHDIKGKRTYDARIAAVMAAHGLRHLLTFNGGDFAVFPHVKVHHPKDVASGAAVIGQ